MDPNNLLMQQEIQTALYWIGLGAIAVSLLVAYYLGRSKYPRMLAIILLAVAAGILGSVSGYVIPFWMGIAFVAGFFIGNRSLKREEEARRRAQSPLPKVDEPR